MQRNLGIFRGVTLIGVALCACDITDGERCGGGLYYNNNTESCMEIEKDDDATDTSTSNTEDAGVDASQDTVTGIGEFCDSNKDCELYEADYCAVNPFTKDGFCTISDCIVSPNRCPVHWTCCEFTDEFEFPDMCIPTLQYDTFGSTACLN